MCIRDSPKVIGTVHCFSGSLEFAKECVKLGYYIGITGVVTFKNARKICEVVEEIPLDRLLAVSYTHLTIIIIARLLFDINIITIIFILFIVICVNFMIIEGIIKKKFKNK